MRRSITVAPFAATLAAMLASASVAQAAPALRVQVNQRGDFLLIGNTLGYDCAPGTPLPVVGTLALDACVQSATNINDSSPDVYWSADDPIDGQALADTTTLASAARSTAVLAIPAGATVTNAFLYWAANNTTGIADTSVTVQRIGGFGPTAVTAIQSWVPGVDDAYQSVADVTDLVQQNGSGAYRVSDIDVAPFANVDKDVLFGGFWMVVFYQLDADPVQNLALFDGLDVVKSGSNQSASLSGFLVPASGFTGKLGVVAWEGDNTGTGDKLLFNNAPLSDTQNPVNNFFNSTRSYLGAAVSVLGDLPQLTGTAQSMAGVDIDVVDITAELTQGQTSAPIQATTSGDTYYLGGFITSISTFTPDFTASTKTATDINGGLVLPGDVIQYTISASNTGNDASSVTVINDALPPQLTFVPGSITITAGDNSGVKTDIAGDDQAEYVAATRTVVVRAGMGANATVGGSIAAGGSTVVTFQAKVNGGVTGTVSNQATVTAGGKLGASVVTVPTNGSSSMVGGSTTDIFVNGCATNADCTAPDPVCDTTISPHACIACATDTDCGSATSGSICDTTSNTCIPGCRGMGGNGCAPAATCTSTTSAPGQCQFPVADAGFDSGHDAGVDSGFDAGHDAGIDSGIDSGHDSGFDSGHDAFVFPTFDAGIDSGSDAGTIVAEGGGCNCSTAPRQTGSNWSWVIGLGVAAAFVGRRRRQN
jgi:uncharacterized repeat protein (TIGR01451 family)/MYXO-CTERM domain-containing protein